MSLSLSRTKLQLSFSIILLLGFIAMYLEKAEKRSRNIGPDEDEVDALAVGD